MRMFSSLGSAKCWIKIAPLVVLLTVALAFGVYKVLAITDCTCCGGAGGDGCTGCGTADTHTECCQSGYHGDTCKTCCHQAHADHEADCKAGCPA